jgi:hypothetical protein
MSSPVCKRLSIYDLHDEINRKKEVREKVYEKILEICYNKIRSASKKEMYKVYFDVPEFVIGLPVYKLNDCIQYVMNNLRSNNFIVEYYFPKILYISWDFEEINKESYKQTIDKQIIQSPQLPYNDNYRQFNPRKLDRLLVSSKMKINDNMEYKPNGKFILNLD